MHLDGFATLLWHNRYLQLQRQPDMQTLGAVDTPCICIEMDGINGFDGIDDMNGIDGGYWDRTRPGYLDGFDGWL